MVTSLTSFPRALRFVILTGLVVLSALPFSAWAAQVAATLDENSVPAGEFTTLTVEVTDGKPSTITPPKVPGLEMIQGGTSQSYRYENGKASSTFGLSYSVTAQKPGEYTIPSFSVIVDGVEMKTQPVKLTVRPSGTQPPPAGAAAPNTGGNGAPEAGSGFITVEPVASGRDYIWVGEIAPVKIKVWIPADLQVTQVAKLQPVGSAFTLQNLSKSAQQTRAVRDGRQYTLLTYDAALSATKAGTYVPDLTLTAIAIVRERSNARRPGNRRDPFGDPFSDFGRVVQKEVEMKTRSGDDSAIEVRELPTQGRPADFNGAVGKFAFEHLAMPGQWQTGEPQSVSAVIGGEGNFNLLAQPEIQPAKNWKAYTGQSEFTAKDAASFKGSQSFRFTAVPGKGGPQTAQLGFSYFDPQAGRYETVMSPLQNIEVRGADLAPETPAAAAPVESPKKPSDPDNLAPLHAGDTMVRSLMPFGFSRTFPVLLGTAGATVLVGLLAGWMRSVRRDPQRAARAMAERAEREAMQEADSFASRGDVVGFFSAARRALQVKLSAQWNRPAQAITLADVTARVPADSPVVEFFREADRLTYSPSADLAGGSLTTWRERLRDTLRSLAAKVAG